MEKTREKRQWISSDLAMPCPFCGSERLFLLEDEIYWVSCSECGANGPSGVDGKEALKRWNLLDHK